jgi:hypothetical protein
MTNASLVIEATDWTAFTVLRGNGMDLKRALKAFVEAETSESASELWWGLEGSAFAQNTIYGAAEPTVNVMMAALADDPPSFRRGWILEVLRFVLSATSTDDPELADRCREVARRGTWLLAAEARRVEGDGERQAILGVLDLLDPEFSSTLRDSLGVQP